MWFKLQPWNLTPDDCDPNEVEWNMWSRRLPPYADLEVGDRVVTVGAGGPADGELLWEVEITGIARDRYDNHDEAWKILRAGLGPARLTGGVTKRTFLHNDYTEAAPTSGYLLGFTSDFVRRIGMPRPALLRIRPHGWVQNDSLTFGGDAGKPRPGQGRIDDPLLKRLIEDAAMAKATGWLIQQGHKRNTIVDTHSKNSYDLAVRRGGTESLRVEVKGLSGPLGPVTVTSGEVSAARHDGVPTVMVVVFGITLKVDNAGNWSTHGGTVHVVDPWSPHDTELAPTEYRYDPRP